MAEKENEFKGENPLAASIDRSVFGADRRTLLARWAQECPGLSWWVPGRLYSFAHKRGANIYLGPSGMAGTCPEDEDDDVECGVVGKEEEGEATAAGCAGAVDREEAVKFMKHTLLEVLGALSRGESDATGLVVYVPLPLSIMDERLSKKTVELEAVLEMAGFECEEVTTRMAKALDPEAAEITEVPGKLELCLSVATLDLG